MERRPQPHMQDRGRSSRDISHATEATRTRWSLEHAGHARKRGARPYAPARPITTGNTPTGSARSCYRLAAPSSRGRAAPLGKRARRTRAHTSAASSRSSLRRSSHPWEGRNGDTRLATQPRSAHRLRLSGRLVSMGSTWRSRYVRGCARRCRSRRASNAHGRAASCQRRRQQGGGQRPARPDQGRNDKT